jgi:hypothetical protein
MVETVMIPHGNRESGVGGIYRKIYFGVERRPTPVGVCPLL